LITVYEARNPALRELYLGTTTLLSHRLAEEFGARPPRGLRHWKPEHGADLRCLVYAIPAGEARGFMRKYARLRRRAWRVRIS
jgi:hypothetical protein